MSLAEYNLRMTAYQERRKEAEKEAMARLWLQERVLKATDKDGTYTIKTWDDFYPEESLSRRSIRCFIKLPRTSVNTERKEELHRWNNIQSRPSFRLSIRDSRRLLKSRQCSK